MSALAMPADAPPVRVGLVGCGFISKVYLENCRALPNLDVLACADMLPERARDRAEEFEVPRACGVDELLADPDIEVVLNLTVPMAHAGITMQALEGGKHVYSEKPLAATLRDGKAILALARRRGLLVGCAPDTFMGAGLQTCRRLVDEAAIGTPVAATAFFLTRGIEMWHPDPEFFFLPGGGPLLDMGPYQLTALVTLLGPVQRVSGLSGISFPERIITSEPRYGSTISVQVPTYVSALLEFASGAIGTMITGWDVWAHSLPHMEVYGSEGSLSAPDPNYFHGDVRLRRETWEEWHEVTSNSPYVENWRGLGLSDLATAIRTGSPHRASGVLAYHVLEIMHGIQKSAETGRRVTIKSTVERPEPLPIEIALSATETSPESDGAWALPMEPPAGG